jgi:hypothetical protein
MRCKGNLLEDLEKTKFLIDLYIKENLLTKTKLMAKYDYLNDEAVKHIETNSNNTYCKKVFPDGTAFRLNV